MPGGRVRHEGSAIEGSRDPEALVSAARDGSWSGRANRLSTDHVDWPIIDEVVAADAVSGTRDRDRESGTANQRIPDPGPRIPIRSRPQERARACILQRRSALAFDAARRAAARRVSCRCSRRLRPGAPPWDAIDWPPQVHLALFVHRVQDVTPGVYAYLRDPAVRDEWKAAMRPEFLWEREVDGRRLFLLLVPIDAGRIANRLSCDQDIAEDGFFSLGMIARFERAAARARRVVLPPAVLGMRPHRPGAVSRGRSGRRAARPASAATTTTPFTTCSGSPATRGKACITSRWACRSKTRG